MSRSPASLPLADTPAILWQLALVVWLGSHLAALFLFMPLLQQAGFAPMLQAEVQEQLRPALLVVTLMASCVQMLVVVRSRGFKGLSRELRGLLVLGVWCLALILLLTSAKLGMEGSLLRALYGAMLGCGLVQLSQPLPTRVRS